MRPSFIPFIVLLSTADSAFTTSKYAVHGVNPSSWGCRPGDLNKFESPLASSASKNDNNNGNDGNSPTEIDVSDLGLTMEDFNAPLPPEFFRSMETTGYESTSRIDTTQNEGCMWTELPEKMKVTLAIPGLRGQPSMCLSVLTATNTLTVTAFGQVVWSCVLRAKVKPETAVFEATDGPDLVPTIEFEVMKAEADERWGGFILQIGENSIV